MAYPYAIHGVNFNPSAPLRWDEIGDAYLTALTNLKVNHVRFWAWNGFDIESTEDVANLKKILDRLETFGMSSTVTLTANIYSFIRGYFGDLELSIEDFDNLFDEIGEHNAIHSWDIHNEPKFAKDTEDIEEKYLQDLYDHIKSIDNRPTYVGIGGSRTLQGHLERVAAFEDICAFHYYPRRGSPDFYDRCWIKKTLPIDFQTMMNAVKMQNKRGLPVWLDETGAATRKGSSFNGYTTKEGQDYQYRLLFSEMQKYPEIEAVNFWQAKAETPFAVFNEDFECFPACDPIREFYGGNLPQVPMLNCETSAQVILIPVIIMGGLGLASALKGGK